MLLSWTYCTSLVLIILKIDAKPLDDHPSFNDVYHPYMVQFGDATTKTATTSDDPSPTTLAIVTEGNFELPLPTMYVEFHPEKISSEIATTRQQKLADRREISTTMSITDETTTATTATDDNKSKDRAVKIIPTKQIYQRGVLDLLFPAERVKGFKNVFDLFRRLLSYTFK